MIWAIVFQVINKDPQIASAATVFGGVLMVMSGVLLVNAQQANVAQLLRRVGGGRTALTTRTGAGQPHRAPRAHVADGRAVRTRCLHAHLHRGLVASDHRRAAQVAPRIAGDYQVYATSSSVSPFDFSSLDRTNIDGRRADLDVRGLLHCRLRFNATVLVPDRVRFASSSKVIRRRWCRATSAMRATTPPIAPSSVIRTSSSCPATSY